MPNKVVRKRRTTKAVELGPGLHAATLELQVASPAGGFRARLPDGRVVVAHPSPSVTTRLLDDCLRARRVVLLTDGSNGPLILGALQTDVGARADSQENVALEGRTLDLSAKDRITLTVGETRLTLEKDGAVRWVGERMTLDMGALVQILSANVRLP